VRKTFILLVFLLFLSPLVILLRATTDKVKKSIENWIQKKLPSWLTGLDDERGD